MPASMSSAMVSSSQHLGPMVHTVLVLRKHSAGVRMSSREMRVPRLETTVFSTPGSTYVVGIGSVGAGVYAPPDTVTVCATAAMCTKPSFLQDTTSTLLPSSKGIPCFLATSDAALTAPAMLPSPSPRSTGICPKRTFVWFTTCCELVATNTALGGRYLVMRSAATPSSVSTTMGTVSSALITPSPSLSAENSTEESATLARDASSVVMVCVPAFPRCRKAYCCQ
mmetsp:Transcript_10488/g.44624  ORF Transcript_10488/g.44624 Transcript_10488/m.44624 type:complete len:225 (-) Transcript_10488:249-923(-)